MENEYAFRLTDVGRSRRLLNGFEAFHEHAKDVFEGLSHVAPSDESKEDQAFHATNDLMHDFNLWHRRIEVEQWYLVRHTKDLRGEKGRLIASGPSNKTGDAKMEPHGPSNEMNAAEKETQERKFDEAFARHLLDCHYFKEVIKLGDEFVQWVRKHRSKTGNMDTRYSSGDSNSYMMCARATEWSEKFYAKTYRLGPEQFRTEYMANLDDLFDVSGKIAQKPTRIEQLKHCPQRKKKRNVRF